MAISLYGYYIDIEIQLVIDIHSGEYKNTVVSFIYIGYGFVL